MTIKIIILLFSFTLSCLFSFLWAQDSQPPEPQENSQKEFKGEKNIAKPQEETSKEKITSQPTSVLEIKRLETEEPLYSIELRNVELIDFFRVVAHDYNLNILVDKNIKGKITASFTNISLEEALDEIADSSNLRLVKKANIIKVVPNLVTKIFLLKHIEAKSLLESETASSEEATKTETTATTSSTEATTSAAETKSSGTASLDTSSQTGEKTSQTNTIFDLLSDEGKVFLGKKPNSLMVIDYPANVARIEEFIKMVDKRMASQVFKLKYLNAAEIVGETTTEKNTSANSENTTGAGAEKTSQGD